MYAKSIAALVASAALAQQALAFNSHRHLHGRHLARRDDIVETHVVTITKTEYVEEAPPTDPTDAPADYSQPQEPQPGNNVYSPPVAQPSVSPQEPAPKEPQPNAYVPPPAAQSRTSSVAPPPATSPPSGSDKGGSGLGFPKRGIAFNNIALADPFSKACQGKCGWCHNWMPSSAKVDCNFIPTLKCNDPEATKDWTKNIYDAIQNGAKLAFSFNEPDNAGQCNISPKDAAASYKQLMNPYAGKIKLCAPAISNSDKEKEGIRWLEAFLKECDGRCTFDYCVAHWYGKVKDIPSLDQFIKDVSKLCDGKKVFVSEYSLIADIDDFKPIANETFMTETAKELDNNSLVAGYSAFYATDGLLMAGTQLSPAGKAYVNA